MAHFNSSVFNVINYAYFNKFYVWEFKVVPNNYWTIKENRINSMKQFITSKLTLKMSEIPEKITLPFIKNMYSKFMYPLVTYYKSRIDIWINECYPNVFNPEDFNINVASDGTQLDSKEELLIHEWLIKNVSNVKYIDRTDKQNKFYNQKDDENYYADWIINDKIIVEYFGMYDHYFTNEIYQRYMVKADRKIKYYKSLSNYDFIDIYHTDLKSKMKGLKQKLYEKQLIEKVS
jgi:predicted GNAT family acetyltransferase